MELLNYILVGSFGLIGVSLWFAKRRANSLEKELREEKYEREVEKSESFLLEAKRKAEYAEINRKALEDAYRNRNKPDPSR